MFLSPTVIKISVDKHLCAWIESKSVFPPCRKWPKEFTYSTEANRGHLPLTNCLRGTQLFKAILEHPAFIKSESSQNGSNNPTWFDEAEANGLGQSF